ncbi:MAG: lysostaphin resistance A-like protein [Rhodomicrobium sp.]
MDKTSPAGFWLALSLLIRLQIIRFARQLTGGLRFFRRKEAGAKRAATSGKSKNSWLLGGLIALSMVSVFTNIAYQAVSNIRETAGTVRLLSTAMPKAVRAKKPPPTAAPKAALAAKTQIAAAPRPYSTRRMALPAADGFALPPKVLRTLTLEALLFLVAITLVAIASGELTRPDWDLEWLATLPVPLSTLLCARILGRAAVNQMGLFALVPFIAIVAWESGYRALAPLIGFAAAMPLLVIAATVQTLCDTGLRLRLGPAQLRNLQAAISIVSVLALFLAMSAGMPGKSGYAVQWGSAMPSWTFWLPPGLAIQTVAATGPLSAAQSLALLALQALLFAVLGIAVLKHQLRFGIAASGARESARHERARKARGIAATPSAERAWLTPIQARELRLLGRDRTFFVQTIVMPAVFVGAQIFFNADGAALLASFHSHPEYLASIAFGISAYALMFSAFQTLNAEGGALWILYSVPQTLESVLRQKATLWGVACLLYPAIIFGTVTVAQGAPSVKLAELAVIVLLGIPIFAVIATSLGVFACDPLAQNVQRRVKISYTYLYILLSSIYIFSVYATSIWQRLSLLTLTALLAFALWQKARDHLPYLLDPAASPPPRVSVSDGLMAALFFFVLQNLVLIIRLYGGRTLTGYDVLVSFSIAGAVTVGVMRLAFWRLHSQGIPKVFGRGIPQALALGAMGGAVAAGLAFLYLSAAQHTALFEQVNRTMLPGYRDVALMAVLAIAAAPVFEEFIFRGLIFGGLRRSMGVAGSVLASAAIFAIVHPPASVIPVFGLGVAAALVYERSKLLIGPMTAHAVYNALIVGFQLFS